MKTIEQLTNVEKAKIMFDLFRDEIPELLNYMEEINAKIETDKEPLIAGWNNPFFNYQQWLNLSDQVAGAIKRYGKNLTKSGNVFSEQLFGGYTAIFSNHCMEQYGLHRAKSPRFAVAVTLFYLPLKQSEPGDHQYLVLETHGGAAYAVICTDQDGNTLVFEHRKDAEAEAADCQEGLVVEI
ncbi:hypothetical protein [Mucilaginibacter rubeus]|uniref:Uncharacterized protein n=1 Tax=Mucilaginibacter rubeus TaxID=2027860 RepID=A0A5C1HTR3_9SPHI|nr:hypothetical protein [Mucilaginibacter rubeus]QEM09194.1 hypothetical protein DEO27_003910 [Mucilaginibacter rubeus]